jgi:ATP adenylyltransferase/5',5'''-P-1,P-4-tetraphosphate phosphorylase II
MSSSYTHNPFQPPFPKGLVIDEIAPKHRLLYSKVYLFKNHLLVTTQQF